MTGWFRIPGAAEYAGVTPGTIRSWMRQGLPHSRKNCNLVLIRQVDIDEYLLGFQEVPENKVDNLVKEIKNDLPNKEKKRTFPF